MSCQQVGYMDEVELFLERHKLAKLAPENRVMK